MQKINKNKILSKNYKKWLETLKEKEHPKYNSSNNKYYNDIKMSLLYCQNGLCAYTEQELCDNKFITSSNWDKEKYKTKLSKLEKDSIQGDLEHFDEDLKLKNGWLWSNFFVVSSHNNCRIKHTKAIIKDILKPDDKNYNPYKYLGFDFETGIFYPNINLNKQEKEKVKYMIEILGINCINSQRKKYLEDLLERMEVGLGTKPYQYITAWNMTLKQLKNTKDKEV
jgi:hypothetical protein